MNTNARTLGHILSVEQMAMISGGEGGTTTLPPIECTPCKDGVGEEEETEEQ